MGQYYSIYLENAKEKEGKLPELLSAVKAYASGPQHNIWQEGVDSINSQTTFKGIVESVFGPFNVTEYNDDRYWEKNDRWHAMFHGSYGWESVMYDIFKVMAPYLRPGSQLFCYPDEGSWCLTVQTDGTTVETAIQ